jgi:hypothetical protein
MSNFFFSLLLFYDLWTTPSVPKYKTQLTTTRMSIDTNARVPKYILFGFVPMQVFLMMNIYQPRKNLSHMIDSEREMRIHSL